jgi:hypothetical protein
VIVTTNLFGDIPVRSDLGLVGWPGALPPARTSGERGDLRGVHGTAPDIAGRASRIRARSCTRRVPHARASRVDARLDASATRWRQLIRERKTVTRDLGGTATRRSSRRDHRSTRLTEATRGDGVPSSPTCTSAPARAEQIDAIETFIQRAPFDVVADLGRSRTARALGEFQRVRRFIRDRDEVSKDDRACRATTTCMWWKAPFGIGDEERAVRDYPAYISEISSRCCACRRDVRRGSTRRTACVRHSLTWRLRDISIIGAIAVSRSSTARDVFEARLRRRARVIVMHHNPVKGELSGRHGLKDTRKVLGAFARSVSTSCFAATIIRKRALHRAHTEGHGDLDGGHGFEPLSRRPPIIG